MATHTATERRFDSAEQEAYLCMWRTYDRLRALEDAFFAEYDLTPQQYNVLRLLRAAHPEPVPTLLVAERLVSRAPDITRMIDKLQDRGLVQRDRPNNDRRRVMIAITAAGLELIGEMAEPLRKCHEQQLGHLSRTELKTLTTLLKAAGAPHEPPNSPWA